MCRRRGNGVPHDGHSARLSNDGGRVTSCLHDGHWTECIVSSLRPVPTSHERRRVRQDHYGSTREPIRAASRSRGWRRPAAQGCTRAASQHDKTQTLPSGTHGRLPDGPVRSPPDNDNAGRTVPVIQRRLPTPWAEEARRPCIITRCVYESRGATGQCSGERSQSGVRVPLDDSLLADRAPRTSRPSLTLTAGRVGLVTDTEADSHQRVSGIERQQPIPRRGDPGDGAQLPRAARPLRRSPAPDRLRRGAPAHRRHGPPSARPAPSGRPDRSSPSGPSGGPWSAG
jgi:hypothetical protein